MLIPLFLLLGLLTDFTDSAEKVWLQRFTIFQIEYITAIIGIPWSLIRIGIAATSDRLPHKQLQAIVVMLVGAVLWFIFSQSVDHDKWAMLVLLVFTELISSTYQTILDGEKAVEFNHSENNMAASCESARLLGSLLASYLGGNAQFYLGISLVCIIQGSAQSFTALFMILTWRKRTIHYDTVPTTEAITQAKPSYMLLLEQFRKPLVVFVTFVSMLPTGSNTFYYFLYGQLRMTTVQLGTIEAVSSCSEIVAAFLFSYVDKPRLRKLAFTTACIMTTYHVCILGIVCRVFAPWDYYVLLYTSIIVKAATAMMSTAYLTEATKSCSPRKEATEYAIITSVPMIGRMFKYAFEISLTKGFGIDHDHFDNVPTMMTTTTLLSLLGVYAAVFILRGDP